MLFADYWLPVVILKYNKLFEMMKFKTLLVDVYRPNFNYYTVYYGRTSYLLL